jgi:hypothetical protein
VLAGAVVLANPEKLGLAIEHVLRDACQAMTAPGAPGAAR